MVLELEAATLVNANNNNPPALAKWREENRVTVSVKLDDSKPPLNPSSNVSTFIDTSAPINSALVKVDSVAHIAHSTVAQDDAKFANPVLGAVLDDDQQPRGTLQVMADTEGRDQLYRVSPETVVAYLEYNRGHWLIDTDPTMRPLRTRLRSLGMNYRPSIVAKADQQGHPGRRVIDKLETNVAGVRIIGQQSDETCSACTEAKLTRQIARRPQEDHAQRPFYRVAIDLIQLLPTGEACLNDDKYAGHFVD
ncbi:hypothetical protein K432DRAFT_389900 [Lepidopterella palustris CBS 459.81]|uniref:GAG-pre-integrase domain-containing protein n=1 Tax=Lepidopterella palustris CBS 459.81 TaxID=1314670 RepID=A0A8E2EHA4_9PEZI|nr:hypothetical protein K432DRAFT_389900 [Lepidopterella palustris CBS 459.81]